MKKSTVSIALAAALGFAAIPAQAAVLAVADLNITGLQLYNVATLGAPTGITIVSDSRTGTANSDFNGVAGTGVGLGNITQTTFGGAPNNVDVKYRLAGDAAGASALFGGLIENNASVSVSTPTVNFALGDMNISGNALVGGSQGFTRGIASAVGPLAFGGANATIDNTVRATYTLTPTATQTVALLMSYDIFQLVFTNNANPNENTLATSNLDFRVTVTERLGAGAITNVFDWAPELLNADLGSFDGIGNETVDVSGSLNSAAEGKMVTLLAGRTYTFNVNQTSNVVINDIPEPASLALVGLGLLGLSALRRRRNA